jgi:carnosine synthase
VRRVVDLSVSTAQAFGLHRGVLHIEAKATSRGPRIVEVNARMGGGRVHEYVRQVWDVDLAEAHLRASLDLEPNLSPSRKPRCTVLNGLVYAPTSGRLVTVGLDDRPHRDGRTVAVDLEAEVGERVEGPEAVFATLLAEVHVTAKDLKGARAELADVLAEGPRVDPAGC